MSHLTNAEIQEYRRMVFETRGEDISDEEAAAEAENLIGAMRIMRSVLSRTRTQSNANAAAALPEAARTPRSLLPARDDLGTHDPDRG